MGLCVFWLTSAVLAGGVFQLKLFYIYFGWTALFLILPQVAFGAATMVIFFGWCHWLATGKARPTSAFILLPASLVVWAIPFGIALRETVRVIVSGLVPFGRYGAELDGWTELKMSLVPTFWFFVPFALTAGLCWKSCQGMGMPSRGTR
jgi:hypothetical protein